MGAKWNFNNSSWKITDTISSKLEKAIMTVRNYWLDYYRDEEWTNILLVWISSNEFEEEVADFQNSKKRIKSQCYENFYDMLLERLEKKKQYFITL